MVSSIHVQCNVEEQKPWHYINPLLNNVVKWSDTL